MEDQSENSNEKISKKVCSFFSSGKCRFGEDCWNLHIVSDTPVGISKEACKPKNKKTKKNQAKKQEPDSCPTSDKKPPMKTASDVVARLLWDSDLPKENFIVAYLDRFRGVIEKRFTDFEWGDIASVDNYTLAIPKHRIQYFKYKHTKIWDKTQRLDLMFGSTGSMTNIKEIMEKTDKDENVVFDAHLEAGNEKCSEKDEHPNYFMTLRITDTEVVQNLVKVVDEICSDHPELSQYRVPVELLHLTLIVCRVEHTEDVSSIVRALHMGKNELHNLLQDIEIKGINQFGNRILYAEVIMSDSFKIFIDRLVNVLSENGAKVSMSDFIPHITLFKVIHNEDFNILASLELISDKIVVGNHEMSNLYFCPIGKGLKNGFYTSATEFSF